MRKVRLKNIPGMKDTTVDMVVSVSGDFLVGQCLEYDICIQAPNKNFKLLKQRVRKTFAAYAIMDELPQPAPSKIWNAAPKTIESTVVL